MKTSLPLIALAFAGVGLALLGAAAEPTNQKPTPSQVVAELNEQVKDMAAAVAARDVHPLHMSDHAMPDEIIAVQKAAPDLSPDSKRKLDTLCAGLVKQASRAHHDAHHNDWHDARGHKNNLLPIRSKLRQS